MKNRMEEENEGMGAEIKKENNTGYVDSVFKMLGLKPEEPFMIRGSGSLYKLSSQLCVYRYFNKTSLSYKEGWHDTHFNLRDILVGNIKIKKIKTEEEKTGS